MTRTSEGGSGDGMRGEEGEGGKEDRTEVMMLKSLGGERERERERGSVG